MRRQIYLAAFALATTGVGIWLSSNHKQKADITIVERTGSFHLHTLTFSNTGSASVETQINGSSIHQGVGSNSRHLFKATNYPPETAEEKEQWAWWQAMRKADPQFEWKMPIEFYGKVVDQFNQPVAGAEVELNWTTVVGPLPDPRRIIEADSVGCFRIDGIQGKRLWIAVNEKGYLPTRDAIASFEYAAFYEDNFHVPDSSKPVVFHLHKLLGAEPMYQFEIDSKMALDGTELFVDVARGKAGAIGDFAFSVRVGDTHDEKGPNYSVTLRAMPGVGFVSSADSFPFNPPADGYENELTVSEVPSQPTYSLTRKFQFYARTRDGKYGVVWAEVSVSRFGDEVNFNATVRYNPSGSRNLEFDPDKWINR